MASRESSWGVGGRAVNGPSPGEVAHLRVQVFSLDSIHAATEAAKIVCDEFNGLGRRSLEGLTIYGSMYKDRGEAYIEGFALFSSWINISIII